MPVQQRALLPGEDREVGTPVARRRRQPLLAGDVLDHGGDECVLVGHVPVQAHGTSPEPPVDRPHAHVAEAVRVSHGDRRADHLVPRAPGRSSPSRRTVLRIHPLASLLPRRPSTFVVHCTQILRRPAMTTTAPTTSTGRYDPLPLWSRLLGRLGRSTMPAARCRAGVGRTLDIPAGDVSLAADHFAPLGTGPCPTLLVRSPYGRGFPWSQFLGANLVRQGFHVLIVATRGTGGSGGDFRPFRDDVRDAPAVLSWLREQPWFDGRLATIGPSYLGYTQLALATDPPPELRAMVLLAPAAHAGAGAWDHGVFRLQHALVVAAGIDTYHRGFAAFVRGSVRMARRLDRVARSQPLLESYLVGTGGRRVPLFEDMLTHSPDDDVWAGTDVREAITNAGPATLLVGGWWDLLLDQTLDLFTRAEAAGRRPRMLLGPWTHTSMVDRAGWPVVLPAALAFLRDHLGVEAPGPDAAAPSAAR